MTQSQFLKTIGGVQHNQYSKFMSMGPVKLSGAANKTFRLSYHFFEKIRIRIDNKQNKFFLIILFFAKLIKNFLSKDRIKLSKFFSFFKKNFI